MFNNINNIKKQKITPILLILFTSLLTGCNAVNITDNSNNNQITLTPTVTPSSYNSEVSEPTIGVEPTRAVTEPATTSEGIGTTQKASEEPKLNDFSSIDKNFKDYTFDISYDEKLDVYGRIYSIHGLYDLNGDGKAEQINAVLGWRHDGSYIEINGLKVSLYPMNPTGEMYIIDIDNKDNYLEVAVFDDGPSGDPTYQFFRYDGNKIYNVGTIDIYAVMDGQGKFISWFHVSSNLEPKFFSAWGEFKNNEYIITNHDIEQYIDKTYEVDGTGYFIPLDKYPENYSEYTIWDNEAQREFTTTNVKLLNIHINSYDRTLNWYYVELPDGERGLLYFWIGD